MVILNLKKLKSKDNKIFFGEYSGFQRFDHPTFQSAAEFENKMRNAFWNPREISLKNDAIEFHKMDEKIQDVMTAIWFYQTLMDSSQNRGLEETLATFVTNPEWESVFKTWSYFEMIHSISYSHILRGIFSDPSAVFDKHIENQEIIKRIETEVNKYNSIVENIPEKNEQGIKLLLSLVLTIYALEGIKFYASFLLTYLINDAFKSIPGATRIIKLINFDEDMHTKASVKLIKDLKNDNLFSQWIDSPWFEQEAHKIFSQVLEDESQWANYLINLGQIEFINYKQLRLFLEYYTNLRLRDIQVKEIQGINSNETDNIRWFKQYKRLNSENVALQESDLAVYNIGIMKNDL